MTPHRPTTTDGSACEPITDLRDALLVPADRRGAATVVDRAGAPVVDAGGFHLGQYVPARPFDPHRAPGATRLRGTYLFGGTLWPHFGHFLFESISRLWACDAFGTPPDGILFFAARRGTRALSVMQEDILGLLGIRLPIQVVTDATVVDRLHVPRQGCGMGGLAAGTPAFRRFVRSALSHVPPRSDAPRIYLSRSAYRLNRGGLFAEAELEARLTEEGYAIYAPERHPIAHQVATYRGAERIVGPDSSALHLAGFAARPGTRIAIVLRRRDGAKDLLPQIAGFTGRPPVVIDAITTILSRKGGTNPTWSDFAELDLPRLGRHLRAEGFIGARASWAPLTDIRRAELLADHERRLRDSLVPVWSRDAGRDAAPGQLPPSHPAENSL
jgi:hypothetical protein